MTCFERLALTDLSLRLRLEFGAWNLAQGFKVYCTRLDSAWVPGNG